MSKVPVQKGPIQPDLPSYKNMTSEQRAKQDYEDHNLRKWGQKQELKTPKVK